MSNHLPILYSFRRCPYAMRARLSLYSAGIEFELREIVLRDKPAHMRDISPKATVPVLLLPCGRVIDESLDIMHYALEQNDPEGLKSRFDASEINDLVQQNDTIFKPSLDRYKYPTRYLNEDCSDPRTKGEQFLSQLNEKLSQNAYLLGATASMADLAIFPFIRQFANVDRTWFDALTTAHLHRWLDKHLESERFRRIMKKFAPWRDGDTPLLFPQCL